MIITKHSFCIHMQPHIVQLFLYPDIFHGFIHIFSGRQLGRKFSLHKLIVLHFYQIHCTAAMLKKCKLVDPAAGSSNTPCSKGVNITDWRVLHTVCDMSNGHLKNCLPQDINILNLESGEGIGRSMKSSRAVWFKSCRNKFDKQKLQIWQILNQA